MNIETAISLIFFWLAMIITSATEFRVAYHLSREVDREQIANDLALASLLNGSFWAFMSVAVAVIAIARIVGV